MDNNTILGEAPIGRLMKGYAIPCIISLLVGALYNIVDQIFIANASYLGSYGNAANTVVFPLTVVALGIAVFIGDGCCAFVSIALGRGAREDAHKSVGNSIVLCVVSSIVLTAVYLIFSEPPCTVRRIGQRGDPYFCRRVLLLYHIGHSFLYVRSGNESGDPQRWQP